MGELADLTDGHFHFFHHGNLVNGNSFSMGWGGARDQRTHNDFAGPLISSSHKLNQVEREK